MVDANGDAFPSTQLLVRITDAVGIYVAGRVASVLVFGDTLETAPPIHSVLLICGLVLALGLFPQFGVYESWRGRSKYSLSVHLAGAWGAVVVGCLVFSFLIHRVGLLSRLWLSCWYLIALALLLMSRGVLYSVLRGLRIKGLNIRHVVIVGYGHTGREMQRRAAQQNWAGYEVMAIYAGDEDLSQTLDSHVVQLRTLDSIPDFVAANKIHEIWITLPLSESAKLGALQYALRNSLVDIRWIPDVMSMQILSNRMINFLGLPAVDLNCPVGGGVRGICKDLFDKLFALAALVWLFPLFVVLAILIKLSSPGPVFFRQPRLGLNGKPFNLYKFRSMKMHDESGVVTQATREDPRVTRIGRFIRRTSLDELPQFINVLRGEMSVVGPRPHALQHNELYKARLETYMLRHRVKPGITGLAQINGYRGETDTDEKMAKRVQFDLQYIQNWTFGMDLKIIVWTAFKGWTGTNAY